jgi:phage terminase small subunit
MPAKTHEDTPLNKRQEAFVQFYLQYYDGKKAAIMAGYKPSSAARNASVMLRLPHIAKRVRIAKEDMARNLGMSRKEQMEKLNALYEKAKPGPTDRMKLKIIEMQNKMLGFDTPDPQDEREKFTVVEIPVPMEPYRGTREIVLDDDAN